MGSRLGRLGGVDRLGRGRSQSRGIPGLLVSAGIRRLVESDRRSAERERLRETGEGWARGIESTRPSSLYHGTSAR
jgi:hypothetical protein